MSVHVHTKSIDGKARDSQSFKSREGARAYAIRRVGEEPIFEHYYAMPQDRTLKLWVSGDYTLSDLFPKRDRRPQ